MTTENNQDNIPQIIAGPRLIRTHEGASAFPVDDPMVRLVYNYGSFLPESNTYYESPDAIMLKFIDAVTHAGQAHPALALQYAAWLRDPSKGKGNRSQPPWVIAVLAGLPECVAHPRFAHLVARCIVRPDDALNIVLAATQRLGDNQLPTQLKLGIAQGLETMHEYQLAKYANTSVNLLPTRRQRRTQQRALASQDPSRGWIITRDEDTKGKRTLRLVDVLGICKGMLSPRLFALYRYLHAPTRQQEALLPELEKHLPLLGLQKRLRATAPRDPQQVEAWIEQALAARMTMEQIFSATGYHDALLHLPVSTQQEVADEPPVALVDQSLLGKLQTWAKHEDLAIQPVIPQNAAEEKKNRRNKDITWQLIRTALWRHLLVARVEHEQATQRHIPFLGDVAFLRNIRSMYQANIPLEHIQAEAIRRQFTGLWPYQILSAAQQVARGRTRGREYQSPLCPEVTPVFDTILEKMALTGLPRKSDGSFYRILGLADVSGSMGVQIGGNQGSATCMSAAIAFSISFSFTTRTTGFGGLAGSWGNTFYPTLIAPEDRPMAIAEAIEYSGGMGGHGTAIFHSIMDLILWLQQHPDVPRPEVLVLLSDMQFYPPAKLDRTLLHKVPLRYRDLIKQPTFRIMPPLAAAIVLYREMLDSDVSLVLWNLASYEGSPVPSGMERLLLLSGFDTNSFRIIEQWLQAGSPGSAMPEMSMTSAESDQSGSSFEAVLAVLRRY